MQRNSIGRAFVLATVLTLVVASCSSDGDDSDTGPAGDPQPAADAGDQSSDDPPSGDDADTGGNNQSSEPDTSGLPAGGDGEYVVDGQSFNAVVYRCEPFAVPGQEAHPDELSVLAYLGGSEGLEVEIGIGTGIGGPTGSFDRTVLFLFHSRSGADGTEQFEGAATHDVDGAWYTGNQMIPDDTSDPLAEAPYTLNGNTITGGGLTLDMTWPDEGGSTVFVDSFNLTIPDETWSEC